MGSRGVMMMVSVPRAGMISVVLVLAASSTAADKHVSIINRLGGGNNMTLHCQSKDTDLGQQQVADGAQFGWSFNDNVSGTTLFYCDVVWEKVAEYHFDAYSTARDFSRCPAQCMWIVSAEGMYGLGDQTGLWQYMYAWPN